MPHAFRSLLKSPGFTLVALVTLALGIGVNTSMFSVLNAYLLQPAPYPQADRLVRVYRTSPQTKSGRHSAPDLGEVRAADSDSLASLTAFHWWRFSLSEPGQPADQLQGIVVSADFFRTIGLWPALGRAFTPEEQQPGHIHVVVLTDALWRSRFGADPDIVGRIVRIDGAPQTVIGVMPAEFAYPLFWGKLDAIRPLVLATRWQNARSETWLDAIARLKPGVSIAQAQAEVATLAGQLVQQYPQTNSGTGIRLVPLHETAVDSTGRTISWLTLGLAGFVQLIACVNLANLQLARSSARGHEFAVRAALGASRLRLMREPLLESLLIALTGGGVGVLLATWLNDLLSTRLHLVDGSSLPIPLDWTVLGFALLTSCLTGLISGLAPAWFAARSDIGSALKQQSRGSTGDRSRHRLRHSLIVAEIAFALVLLAGAAFFVRGVQRFTARDPGWQSAGLITGMITLPKTLPTDRYLDAQVRRTFYDRLLQRLSALPGVERAALASSLPVTAFRSSSSFVVEGRDEPPAGHEPLAASAMVSPDFFDTLRLPLLEGRTFPPDLRANGPRVVVINESMARQIWPGESAIGKRIGSADPNNRQWAEVIGVVRDAGVVASFSNHGSPWQVYYSLVQEPWGYLSIVLRAQHPEKLAEPLRRTVASLDADLPVANITTVTQTVDRTRRDLDVTNQLLSGFALLGLVLASVGLYGVISNLVVQRTQEFGIRMALGARPGDVLRLVLGRGIQLALIGVVLGLAGAAGLLRALATLLPGLSEYDPLALVVVVVLLLTVALIASVIPARRAMRIDPNVALRAE